MLRKGAGFQAFIPCRYDRKILLLGRWSSTEGGKASVRCRGKREQEKIQTINNDSG
jgi:hypothetical protein